jgi:hypothetical protein
MEILHPDWLSNPVMVEKKKDERARYSQDMADVC